MPLTKPHQGQDYVVGDIQGCYDELIALLAQVNFDPAIDHLWLTGDLVARGPKSLETLRYVKSLGDSATTVLGNHDLHLLATYYGIKKVKANDRLDDVFDAPDVDALIHWLRQQPLLAVIDNHNTSKPVIMTHAGISPQWEIPQAIQLAKEVEEILQNECCVDYLTNMYQNTPAHWDKDLTGYARFRYIVNALTRMRFCYRDGGLEFGLKCHPRDVKDPNIQPWFTLSKKNWQHYFITFGHWASLMGECPTANIIALDTGCVWGNHLMLLRVSDNKRFTSRATPKVTL